MMIKEFWDKLQKAYEAKAYELWRTGIMRQGTKLHPLMAFPFQVYMEFENPKVFEEQGFAAARKAAIKWVEEYPNRATEAMNKVVEDYKPTPRVPTLILRKIERPDEIDLREPFVEEFELRSIPKPVETLTRDKHGILVEEFTLHSDPNRRLPKIVVEEVPIEFEDVEED